MDDNQRKRILQNIEMLVNQTEFEKLSQACLNSDLLTPVMLNNIYHAEPQKLSTDQLNEEAIKRERHRRLFEKITKRGPEAFVKLRLILESLNYKDALRTLDGKERMISISRSKETGRPYKDDDEDDDINVRNNNIEYNNVSYRQLSRLQTVDDSSKDLHEYDGPIQPKRDIVVEKAATICKSDKLETYPMDSKQHRGVFFLVNIIDFHSNETRLGSDEDVNCLLKLFKQLGFKLYFYENLTRNSFLELLDKLLELEEIKHTQCFVMALMTHGELVGGVQRISFTDGSVEKVEEIEKRFYHKNCPNLIGKPKIFIYPYCRGESNIRAIQHPNTISKTQTEGVFYGNHENYIAQFSDVIKCYATTEGNVAHRHRENGSWYIQCFVDTLAKHACDTSFEDMLKKIQENVEKLSVKERLVQTPSYVNIGFNKCFYFNPGV